MSHVWHCDLSFLYCTQNHLTNKGFNCWSRWKLIGSLLSLTTNNESVRVKKWKGKIWFLTLCSLVLSTAIVAWVVQLVGSQCLICVPCVPVPISAVFIFWSIWPVKYLLGEVTDDYGPKERTKDILRNGHVKELISLGNNNGNQSDIFQYFSQQ
jgi:hypothetical protein